MTLSEDIDIRAPGQNYFILWTVVNQGFIVSTQVKTNEVFERIQAKPIVDQYLIQLGTNGTLPVTFFGSAGTVEHDEALEITEWYADRTAQNIKVWLLTIEGELIWEKGTGIVPTGPQRFTDYVNDFLPTVTPPNLEPISEVEAAFSISFALTSDECRTIVQQKLASVGGGGNKINVQLSSTGLPPVSHWAGQSILSKDDEARVKQAFTVLPCPSTDVALLSIRNKLTWNTEVGEVVDGPITRFEDFLSENNLKIIRRP